MAMSNRDRIDRMFQTMAPPLDDFISSVVGQANPSLGAKWPTLVHAKDMKSGAPETRPTTARPAGPVAHPDRRQHHAGYKPGWYPISKALGGAGESSRVNYGKYEIPGSSRKYVTDDDAYRALDTGERLLKLIGAAKEADEVHSIGSTFAESPPRKTIRRPSRPPSTIPRPLGSHHGGRF